jgi:hypothetical protein
MSIPTNTTSIGGTTKKSQYDSLYNNAILCDTGGTPGGAQTIPGVKTFTDAPTFNGGINVENILAIDGDGLSLKDDGGNLGLFIEDGGNIGIKTSSPGTDLDVYGDLFLTSDTDNRILKIGQGCSTNIQSSINLVGDTTYTLYGLQILRYNTGENAPSYINHRGTGGFNIRALESAAITFRTSDVYRFKIDSNDDYIGIGGYAGDSNRDCRFYWATDTYNFWDESESELNINITGTNAFAIRPNVTGIYTTDLEAWHSGYSALEFPLSAISFGNSVTHFSIMNNAYYDGDFKYKSTEQAALFLMNTDGTIRFDTAVSGTEDSNITWVSKLLIDNASDSIGIGGYAGGSNRDCRFYWASDSYDWWDESESERKFNIAGTDVFVIKTDIIGLGSYVSGVDRDTSIYLSDGCRIYYNDSDSEIVMTGADIAGVKIIAHIRTQGTGVFDIGNPVDYWDDMYADDFNNVADFDHLDTFDDLAAICAIKGSGEINPRSGLEMIDDDTLPEWLLTKSKDGKNILYGEDGKPYISLKTGISFSWGAIRQLFGVVTELINRVEQLEKLKE